MGTGIEIGLAAVSLAATAASTGIAYYGQQQQASNAQAIANYNAAAQRQNADIQARLAQQQSTWNQQAQMAQYQAQQNNATTLDNQARAVEAQGREQVDRLRVQQERLLATQRAHYAKAGVVNEGSPLAVLADTAKTTELGIQDAAYQTELESRQWQQKAADERFQSGFSLMDASIEKYKQSSIAIGQQIAYRDADLTKMQGTAQAQGYQTAAGATLLSGAASMAKTGFDDYYRL
ncbi:hypothetical protein BH09VER1_BH09VER1_46290 [soil metagenome]